jgi:predicted nucleic acid-binding Zn ribbon protein
MTPSLRARVLREWQPFGVASLNVPTGSPASQLVPEVMKKLGLEQRLRESQAFFLWPEIVGADVARHAQPVSLRSGLLVVSVDHPVWLQELSRYYKPMILQKVQERVGKKAVRDIRFRIG